jgi:N-acetylated-alpha-linked acidic dipeptidase
MSTARIVLPALAVVAALAAGAEWQRPSPSMFGFTRQGAAREATVERRFLDLPRPDLMSGEHAVLSGQPHLAGSKRDYELLQRIRDHFVACGLEQVEVTTHEVLLPWPEEVLVEMTAPAAWRAPMRETRLPDDPDTAVGPEVAGIPYFAYSASGDVTAAAVDAGGGEPADYAALNRRGADVRGRIVLVRNAGPYSYRGSKVLTAERHGAAGILIYSDPADRARGTPALSAEAATVPSTLIQRGGVGYDFIAPGDPLTPGWASVAGARRLPLRAAALPHIIAAPLSFNDARTISEAREPVVHLRVRLDDRIRPVWTVTGLIRGADRPDDMVIVGNHRDAWIYGGVDPSSGTAALMELARTLGALSKAGSRPRRSILFASWDAEEFALTSSTEWGEQYADRLSQHAVAYINVDSAVSGPRFTATTVPALNRVIAEVTEAVQDPATGASVAASVRDRRAREAGVPAAGAAREVVGNRVGGGSDYVVFLDHLGIPVADIGFAGPYGVYHSLYDTHAWVARVGDPGFRYHAALVRIWGLLALRLASADALPLDYVEYADRIAGFIDEVERRPGPRAPQGAFDALRASTDRMRSASAALARERDNALGRGDRQALEAMNGRVLAVERALLDPDGLPGRRWYRHLIYAPAFSYAPEVLPGISAAIESGNLQEVAIQAGRLAAALDKAAEALRQAAEAAL